MKDILNKCFSVSVQTIGVITLFLISISFTFGIWMNSISNDITTIKNQQAHMNTFLEEHIKMSNAVVKRAERVTTLVANKCCTKSVAAEIDNIMYPN